MKILFAGEGYGRNQFPRKKPFIVIFNHNSHVDILTIALVATFKAHGMGKYELFKVPVLSWWLHKINVHPIIRGIGDEEGFAQFKRILQRKEILIISPEGTRRWQNGKPPRPKSGFIRLAQTFHCPIVPVAIYGTRGILPPGSFLPRWRKIIVQVGKPVRLVPFEVKQENREVFRAQAIAVMDRVYELLPKHARPKTLRQCQNKDENRLILKEKHHKL